MNTRRRIRFTSILSLATACLMLPPARAAATTILHNFIGNSDGWTPWGSLTLSGSTLYGMTNRGGSSGDRGTVFRVNTDGTGYAKLRTFTGGASDGSYPYGSLTLSGSKLYGMTGSGGSVNWGTIFSINTDGTGFGLLHTFADTLRNGGITPHGSLMLSGSKLYGMAVQGGIVGGGSVFSMNTDGTGFSLLHSFTGASDDGSAPYGSLTLSGSKLYGMTTGGGPSGSGTIFSMNTDGTGFSLLHGGDGSKGTLTLIGSKIYGLSAGDGNGGQGTLFSMNLDGTGYGLLHSFTGGASDGANPRGSLTLSGTTFYGTTSAGGTSNRGTIFSINTDGTGFGLLDSFAGAPADGNAPYGDLTLSGDASTLYGMTLIGGTTGGGTVFSKSLVPEPSTALLLVAGAGLLLRRRRG